MSGRIWIGIGAGCALVAAVISFAASPRMQWLVTPKSAFAVLAPVAITDARVESVQWSTDGAYLLLAVRPDAQSTGEILAGEPATPPPGLQLLAWDRRTRRVTRAWSTEDASIRFEGLFWLAASHTALVEMSAPVGPREAHRAEYGLLAVDAATGASHWIPGLDHQPEPITTWPSPSKPLAVAILRAHSDSEDVIAPPTAYWEIGEAGAIRSQRAVIGQATDDLVWSADGASWYGMFREGRRRPPTYMALGEDGKFAAATPQLAAEAPSGPDELWLHDKPLEAKQRKVTRTLRNLWLSSPAPTFRPDVLLSTDSRQSLLSPTGDAVFFDDNGIAKVRPLVRLTDDQKKALFDQAKKEAMSNAKQCALGLIMYANDYDDLLPPSGGFDNVDPYLKNADIEQDFVFTPPSQLNLTQLGDPATTPIGHIDGPGGQAVAYADGHVVWVPGP